MRDLVTDLSKASNLAFEEAWIKTIVQHGCALKFCTETWQSFFSFPLPLEEGRSPFIFKADEISHKTGIDQDDDPSDYSVRSELSRSLSSLDEEPSQDPYSALKAALADAMDSGPSEPADTFLMDSQPIETPYRPGSGEAAAVDSPGCEIVEPPAAPAVQQKAAQSEPQTEAMQSAQLRALLFAVKQKIKDQESKDDSAQLILNWKQQSLQYVKNYLERVVICKMIEIRSVFHEPN